MQRHFSFHTSPAVLGSALVAAVVAVLFAGLLMIPAAFAADGLPAYWRFSLRTVSADAQQHEFATLAEVMTFLEGDLLSDAGSTKPP